jgi:hypothetical protein
MPIITCPKCRGQLRFPDGIPARRVKCPNCGNVFLSSEGVSAADAAAAAAVTASAEPGPPTPRDDRSDFTRRDDDRDRRARRPREDDSDDGRHHRSGPGRDHHEYGDRDRRRERDDDDRGRRRRRRDEVDDYDDWPRRPDPAKIDGQFNRASLGLLLAMIGGWLHVAAMALMAFVVFLDWVGVREGLQLFVVMAGLLAMGNWLTSATGLGFMISGPRDRGALGFSIATAAVAGVHILMLIVIATARDIGPFGRPMFAQPAEVYWDAFVTQLRAIPVLIFVEIGVGDFYRGIARGSALPVFTNLVEAARLVLFFLMCRAIMLCARDSTGARLSMQAMVGSAIVSGALLFVGMLFGLLFLAVRPSNPTAGTESASAVFHLFFLVLYLVLAGVAVGSTLIIRSVKGRIDYRR